ncbi:MAG: sigma-70 family RNA polymerase sigma factor [Sphingobacteriales bacterium]|nr:MAG: sigma-70 family RNA polymerase sigma factor [Sphingobacteriales bacterium]
MAATTTYNQSDEELLKLYRTTGDSQWLGALLQRYTLLLLGVAMKYLKDRDAAEDAVQQVFLKSITHLPQEEIQNFKGWLYVLMRNHCLQQLRDRHYQADESALQYISEEKTDAEELQLKDRTLDQMSEALEELNTEQRDTIQMFYLQKMSYQQIIDNTGFSFQQVKSYIQNGKRNLKLLLLKKQQKNNG